MGIFYVSLAIVIVSAFIIYNKQAISIFARFIGIFTRAFKRFFGGRLAKADSEYQRNRIFLQKSLFYKVYVYYEDILSNFDLLNKGVTTFGFMTLLLILSGAASIAASIILSTFNFLIIFLLSFFYILSGLFKLMSLSHLESKEEKVMEAVDLLVSDIQGGTKNAIERYKDSFHPDIQPHFKEFLDNIRYERLTFEGAMNILADRLGGSFENFAAKAIYFDRNAGEDVDSIFSSIIDYNMRIRLLRQDSKIVFTQIKIQFVASIGLIFAFVVGSVLSDPWTRDFILNTVWGNAMVFELCGSVAFVLGYLAKLKASSYKGVKR